MLHDYSGAYYSGQSVSSESAVDSGRSEGEAETLEQQSTVSAEGIMLEEALGLLSSRWERLDGAQALRMLPSDTKLQVHKFFWTTYPELQKLMSYCLSIGFIYLKRFLLQQLIPFLEPLLRKSSEAHRNAAVIKNLRRTESLQVLLLLHNFLLALFSSATLRSILLGT